MVIATVAPLMAPFLPHILAYAVAAFLAFVVIPAMTKSYKASVARSQRDEKPSQRKKCRKQFRGDVPKPKWFQELGVVNPIHIELIAMSVSKPKYAKHDPFQYSVHMLSRLVSYLVLAPPKTIGLIFLIGFWLFGSVALAAAFAVFWFMEIMLKRISGAILPTTFVCILIVMTEHPNWIADANFWWTALATTAMSAVSTSLLELQQSVYLILAFFDFAIVEIAHTVPDFPVFPYVTAWKNLKAVLFWTWLILWVSSNLYYITGPKVVNIVKTWNIENASIVETVREKSVIEPLFSHRLATTAKSFKLKFGGNRDPPTPTLVSSSVDTFESTHTAPALIGVVEPPLPLMTLSNSRDTDIRTLPRIQQIVKTATPPVLPVAEQPIIEPVREEPTSNSIPSGNNPQIERIEPSDLPELVRTVEPETGEEEEEPPLRFVPIIDYQKQLADGTYNPNHLPSSPDGGPLIFGLPTKVAKSSKKKGPVISGLPPKKVESLYKKTNGFASLPRLSNYGRHRESMLIVPQRFNNPRSLGSVWKQSPVSPFGDIHDQPTQSVPSPPRTTVSHRQWKQSPVPHFGVIHDQPTQSLPSPPHTTVSHRQKVHDIVETFEFMQRRGRIVREPLGVSQGGRSADGCVVISSLVAMCHVMGAAKNDNCRLLHTVIAAVIRSFCVPILEAVRGHHTRYTDYLEVSPVLEQHGFCGDVNPEVNFFGGNIWNEESFDAFINAVDDQNCDVTGATFLHGGHATAFLKLANHQGFEEIDSLGQRWWCKDAEALRSRLKHKVYATYGHFPVERCPFDENAIQDPRWFQARVFKQPSPGEKEAFIENLQVHLRACERGLDW